jgi:hypothetical protein
MTPLAQSPETARRIEQQLAQAVPNWREIAADPDWARWLAAVNPATGRGRREQLDGAIERGDVQVVVETLQRFLQERREGWPIREIGQGLQPRAATASYTRHEIKQNYERRRRGEYGDEEWTRLERSMHQAVKHGRVAGAVPLAKNFSDGR